MTAPYAGLSIRRRCSGCRGALLTCRSPVPWEQIVDFVGGVIWKAAQHVCKPGLRVEIVHLAGFDQGVDDGGAMAAPVGTGESRVLSAHRSRPFILPMSGRK